MLLEYVNRVLRNNAQQARRACALAECGYNKVGAVANSPRRCLGLRRGLFSRRPRRCFIACSSALATAGGTLQWSCTRWRASRAGAVPRCGPPVQAIRLRWAFSFSPLPFFHALRRFALACGVFPVAMVVLYYGVYINVNTTEYSLENCTNTTEYSVA